MHAPAHRVPYGGYDTEMHIGVIIPTMNEAEEQPIINARTSTGRRFRRLIGKRLGERIATASELIGHVHRVRRIGAAQ